MSRLLVLDVRQSLKFVKLDNRMNKIKMLADETEALITNPPPHWQVLSQAIVNVSRNCVLAIDRHGIVFLANTLSDQKFGASSRKPLKDIIPSLLSTVEKTLADGKYRVVPSMQVKSEEYRIVVSPLKLHNQPIGAICLLEESTELNIPDDPGQ